MPKTWKSIYQTKNIHNHNELQIKEMIKTPHISIIVPVYNVELYLATCIDSLINQTFSDIEILLVDDGSLDESGKICDEYAAEDSRIRVFHTSNNGVTSAR